MYEEYNGRVLKLGETRVWRTYSGGATIDTWHGKAEGVVGQFPEDWVASTTQASNPGREEIVEGLSKVLNIEGEPLLKDVLEAQGENYFGAKHLDKIGNTAGILIKLIDSAERLTIQVHPDREYARTVFQSEYGKTESWYILEATGDDPCVYFGFKPHVTREIWKDIFDRQDIPAMLDCLHKIKIKAGDSFFIPGGLPHAIGKGCFLAEVQEPTDYTMRTELITPGGLKIHENQCHQGVGYEKMMDCFHFEGMSLEETCAKWKSQDEVLYEKDGAKHCAIIDKRYTDLFKMHTISVTGEMPVTSQGQLKTWIVVQGSGTLTTEKESVSVEKGDFILLPASLAEGTLKGEGLFIMECLPKEVS